MDNLISRLEAATGPDRELDALIHFHVVRPKEKDELYQLGYQWLSKQLWLETAQCVRGTPHYTASIDDALTLLNTDSVISWTVSSSIGGDTAWILTVDDDLSHREYTAVGATPALALTTAAMKAREDDA